MGSNAEGVGDDAVREATGKGREEWFALLDDAGAAEWKHQAIATWLVREQHVDPWWSQGVTVAYEQARGIRLPGQLKTARSRRVSAARALEKTEALRALADVVSRELDGEPLGAQPRGEASDRQVPARRQRVRARLLEPGAGNGKPRRSDSLGAHARRLAARRRQGTHAQLVAVGRMTRDAREPWASVEP